MEKANDSTKIDTLGALNPMGCDDYFICCASFEERCLRGPARLNYKIKYSIIFVIEEPLYEKEVMDHLEKLKSELSVKTTERIFTISCQRQNPMDGIVQLKEILRGCQVEDLKLSFATIDISGFTKIYLFELFHYLVAELRMKVPRIIHTTQYYRPSKLTQGVEEIVTMPSFFGDPSTGKQTLLVLFLGFEPERALTVWESFYPLKTVALLESSA